MSWITKRPKLWLGLIGLLLVVYLFLRFSRVYYEIQSFLLGVIVGLTIGIIPFIRLWLSNKKKNK
ncbi:MAG TPA: hypothetical protein DCE41_14760 [Cytophagales bacterium]|nr:hypothetical protein [Cytophagales bacterium]HAA17848.1 hypothetical protein [Cytophagales bacterium]HAP58231.1 hypothetical protein [Cytophagales bacterium]